MTKVFGFVRYSVISEGGSGWRVSKSNDYESYKDKIFDRERMMHRLELFKNVTLPSLAGQSVDVDSGIFKLIVLVSKLIPKEHLRKLEEAVEAYKFCEIVFVGVEKGSLGRACKRVIEDSYRGGTYSSFRVDDDDALSINYLEALLEYTKPELEGYAISFPKGFEGLYDFSENKFTHLGERYEPKIALGLAVVSGENTTIKHIFQLGNHTQIDQRIPVILDGRDSYFIRTWHESGDMMSTIDKEDRHNRIEKRIKEPSSGEVVSEKFRLPSGLI